MKRYLVEYITKEQAKDSFGYCYSGEWFEELTESESEIEAITQEIICIGQRSWHEKRGVIPSRFSPL